MNKALTLIVIATLTLVLQTGGPFAQTPPPPVPAPGPEAQPVPPPLPAPKPAAQYYYEDNGRPVGPVSLDDLMAKVREGKITRETLVWKIGTAEWVAAKDIRELVDIFGARPPPVPAEQQINRLVVGTWQSESTTSGVGVLVKTIVTYAADGTFQGSRSWHVPGMRVQITQPISGTWTVKKLTNTSFTATLVMTGEGPTTFRITILDNDTLRNEDTNEISHRLIP